MLLDNPQQYEIIRERISGKNSLHSLADTLSLVWNDLQELRENDNKRLLEQQHLAGIIEGTSTETWELNIRTVKWLSMINGR